MKNEFVSYKKYQYLDIINQAKNKTDYKDYDTYLKTQEACLKQLIDTITIKN